jgi:hypothetical protein
VAGRGGVGAIDSSAGPTAQRWAATLQGPAHH